MYVYVIFMSHMNTRTHTYEQFGNAGYTVRIHPTPRIPLGVPKWIPDPQIPIRYTLFEDRMAAKWVVIIYALCHMTYAHHTCIILY